MSYTPYIFVKKKDFDSIQTELEEHLLKTHIKYCDDKDCPRNKDFSNLEVFFYNITFISPQIVMIETSFSAENLETRKFLDKKKIKYEEVE